MSDFSQEQKTVLALLRASLWESREVLPPDPDWTVVDAIAKAQAVIPLVYNGAVVTRASAPEAVLSKWKKATVYGVVKNERLLAAQDQVVDGFAKSGIQTVILKGSSVSRYYPAPDLRVLGDVDVLVQKTDIQKAMEVLQQLGYVLREADHDFHYGFSRKDAYVELHYDVTTLPDSVAGIRTRQETEQFLADIAYGQLLSHRFPVLTQVNQALSLLLHMIRHMYETGIGLRQMCDWMMFVADTQTEPFLQSILPVLKHCGLLQYAKAATAVCVKYLGLPQQKAAWCDVDDRLAATFLESVFSGGNMGRAENNMLQNLLTDTQKLGTTQSSAGAVLSHLNAVTLDNFPNAGKRYVLRPFLWLFLLLRYGIRTLFGKRKKIKLGKEIKKAKRNRELYEQLNPFGVDES